MKKISVLLCILLQMGLVKAQDKSYEKEMLKNVQYLDTVQWNYDSYKQVADRFAFIGERASAEWRPLYYHAYCVSMMSRMVKDPVRMDSLTDVADVALRKADSLSSNNAEIYSLKALNVANKINADFMKRGLSYSKIANDILDRAQELNADNPRIFYVRGMLTYFRPKAFGGGKEQAKPQLEKALALYSTEKQKNKLDPHWGKADVEDLLGVK